MKREEEKMDKKSLENLLKSRVLENMSDEEEGGNKLCKFWIVAGTARKGEFAYWKSWGFTKWGSCGLYNWDCVAGQGGSEALWKGDFSDVFEWFE